MVTGACIAGSWTAHHASDNPCCVKCLDWNRDQKSYHKREEIGQTMLLKLQSKMGTDYVGNSLGGERLVSSMGCEYAHDGETDQKRR
jgi:hypothetical protein